MSTSAPRATTTAGNYRLAFALVTSLFFLWGLSYGLLDVLNKHFQETLHVTRAKSALLQFTYFGAYFVWALPAGMLMSRKGYKTGILLGLALFATGALLFIPATAAANFHFFIGALFVIASGAAFLETAANPYATFLGTPDRSEQRLNLAQSFNGVGSFIGPFIGGSLFFAAGGGAGTDSAANGVRMTYVVIAGVVVLLAILIARTKMPFIREEAVASSSSSEKPLRSQRHFIAAVVAQFFYVAAQVAVNTFFINYVTEHVGVSSKVGAFLLAAPMACYVLGRFVGTGLMSRIAPASLLTLFAAINVALSLVVMAGFGWASVVALIAISFFMSIQFPTIFALGVKNLGANTKRGASFIVMSIVGGAIVPPLMGLIADHYTTAISYVVPALCFAVVVWFGKSGWRAGA